MPGDPFYRSKAWKALVAAVWKRDKGRCVCGAVGKVVDHLVSRRNGGTDTLANLRLLCRRCDNAIKERTDGQRARGGVLPGCDSNGVPTDPAHPWHTPGGVQSSQPVGGTIRGGPRIPTKFPGPV